MEKIREKITQAFEGTVMGENLKRLSQIYDETDEECGEFCRRYNVHCTEGCGTCCENFVPDITPVEAEFVAAYILLVKNDLTLINRIQAQGHTFCPLYDRENPHHCQVYPVRPLVCRLFGQCPSRMKDGSADFRRCRFEGGKNMTSYLHFDSPDVKTMDDYGIRVHEISSDVSNLDEAVARALGTVFLTSSYLGILGVHLDDDTPNPTPSPQAS